MSATMTPAEALSRIPGWDGDAVKYTKLKGGLTNRIHVVEKDEQKAVLRLDAAHTSAFELDRRREISVLEPAVNAGLAPEVIFCDVDTGILLSAFISGRTWEASDLNDTANLDAVTAMLREVHELPKCGVAFDANRVARRYVENLSSHYALHAFGLRCREIIESIGDAGNLLCCHNDLVIENVISASNLMLLDWEYACDNDPLFDLASLIGYHDLSDKTAQDLLSAYSGGSDGALSDRLDEQVRLYDAIQWLWLANRHMVTHTSIQAARLEMLQQRIR